MYFVQECTKKCDTGVAGSTFKFKHEISRGIEENLLVLLTEKTITLEKIKNFSSRFGEVWCPNASKTLEYGGFNSNPHSSLFYCTTL
jgi:hypothetical protein